jgi:hypothetical protein
MTSAAPPMPSQLEEVPVLTEVVGLPVGDVIPGGKSARSNTGPLPELTAFAAPGVPVEDWLASSEEQVSQRVLADVQRQVDRMFEYRVRESLGPALARLTEAFLRETRAELALILTDVVRRAVAQELAKHRPR